MQTIDVQKILNRKEPPNLYDVVEPVLRDPDLRRLLVEGSYQKNETVRYNCVRVLLRAMASRPQLFYEYWDTFASMITSANGFYRSSSAQAIAYLASVDKECRLDGLLRDYLALLDDSKVMVSHYFIETLDLIYRARPDLRAKILTAMLRIDRTQHPPQRKEMLKADIMEALDRLYDGLPPQDRKKAIAFAASALQSSSPKTRKAAKSFTAKHPR